jgi:hypothetical protein
MAMDDSRSTNPRFVVDPEGNVRDFYPELYGHDTLVARRKSFTLICSTFLLESPEGHLLAVAKMRPFGLRRSICLYADKGLMTELLRIHQDNPLLDIDPSYTIRGSQSNEVLGSFCMADLACLLEEYWEIRDADGSVLGQVRRTGVPPNADYQIEADRRAIATMRSIPRFTRPAFSVDLSSAPARSFSRPLAIATVIILLAIDTRRQSRKRPPIPTIPGL